MAERYNSQYTGAEIDRTVAEAVRASELEGFFLRVYPIGSIYMSVSDINPSELFGGVWEAWGQGRVPVGVAPSGTFNDVEKTGGHEGVSYHRHDVSAITGGAQSGGAHTHATSVSNTEVCWVSARLTAGTNAYGLVPLADGSTQKLIATSGGAHTHNIAAHNTGYVGTAGETDNLPPYMTCYMWKRIS